MSLAFPSPGGFVQTLRQMRRGLSSQEVILVVEGPTDRKAFMHILAPTVKVIPARGKDNLLAAYDSLSAGTPNSGYFYIMDCDNKPEAHRKGNLDLAITTNRDLEADLLFSLNAYERLAIEVLADIHVDHVQLEATAERVLANAVEFAQYCGELRDAARSIGVRVRHLKKPVRPHQLFPSLPGGQITLGSVASAMAAIIGWTPTEKRDVLNRVASSPSPCVHASDPCDGCLLITFCNGHDVVDALAVLLSNELSISVVSADIERYLRMGLDRAKLNDWRVAQRVRRWEEATGATLLYARP